jgi:hypothetical protein
MNMDKATLMDWDSLRSMENQMTEASLFRGTGHDHKHQNFILNYDPKTDDIDCDSVYLHNGLERVWAYR